jgi:aryl carrier-like protein
LVSHWYGGALRFVTFYSVFNPHLLIYVGFFGRIVSGKVLVEGKYDSLVVLDGSNIDVSKVSAALVSASPQSVRTAVTMLISDDHTRRDILVSFIQKRQARSDDSAMHDESFIKSLYDRIRLPTYMMPSFIVPMENLLPPKNATQRDYLESYFHSLEPSHLDLLSCAYHIRRAELADLSGKTSKTMDIIINELKTVSGALNVTPFSNLFEIGIDSLSAMKIVWKLKKLGIDVTISELIEYPSALSLTQYLEAKISKQVVASQLDMSGANDSTNELNSFRHMTERMKSAVESHLGHTNFVQVLPCTPLQEGMLIETLGSGFAYYFQHTALELSEHVDINKLQMAWSLLCQRHSILRTQFELLEGQSQFGFVQVVYDNILEVRKINFESMEALKAGFLSLCQAISNEANGFRSPVRVFLLTAGSTTWFVNSLHHAVYDAWSYDLMLSELQELYATPNLESPIAGYQDVLEHIYSLDMESSSAFWKQYLAGSCVSKFPRLHENPGQEHQVVVRKTFGSSLSRIQDTCGRLQTTLTVLGEVLWGILLSKYLEAPDIIFGQVWSGRNIPVDGVESIIGPCFNTIPTRLNVDPNLTFGEFVSRCHNNHISMTSFQHTSLRNIHKWTSSENDSLFDTIYLFQKRPHPNLANSPSEMMWHQAQIIEYSTVCNYFFLSLSTIKPQPPFCQFSSKS